MTEENLLTLKSSADLRDADLSLYKGFDLLSGEERNQVSKQMSIVNDKLNDLYDKGESIDIVVPHPGWAYDYLEIKTFLYSDGQYGYGLNVDTNTVGMGFRILERDLSDTKEKAIQKAIAHTLSWVASHEKGCSATDKKILEKIKETCEKAIKETKYQQLAFI